MKHQNTTGQAIRGAGEFAWNGHENVGGGANLYQREKRIWETGHQFALNGHENVGAHQFALKRQENATGGTPICIKWTRECGRQGHQFALKGQQTVGEKGRQFALKGQHTPAIAFSPISTPQGSGVKG